MKQQLENRLTALKSEFESGQQKLKGLEMEASNLQQVLLRISGAIQVLEEELGKTEKAENSFAVVENGTTN